MESEPYQFGIVHRIVEGTLFQLPDDHYIVGLTTYYTPADVYGLDLYTKTGATYSSRNDERLDGLSSDF